MILAEAAKSQGGWDVMLIAFLPLIVIMFWMFRSARKKEEEQKKKREEMLNSVRRNDSVVTAGGLHGDVVTVNDKTVILRVDGRKDVQLRFEKSALREVVKRAEGTEKKEE